MKLPTYAWCLLMILYGNFCYYVGYQESKKDSIYLWKQVLDEQHSKDGGK